MPRRESKFVTSYFDKPWIQPLLATFDPKKVEIGRPDHVVAQIIKVKEGCPESFGEMDQEIYGYADLHDSYVRTNAVFTKQVIEEFEKEEELLSGCEFEHLPNTILVLKKFHVIPKITDQLCNCNLVICIEEFSLLTHEGPTCTISSLPWARATSSVACNLYRLWNISQGDGLEESGTEALTNSDLPFSCDDLSQLLAEVKKDSSMLQSSQNAEGNHSTVASESQGSPAVGPVTSGLGPDCADLDQAEALSQSSHHTPEKSRDAPGGQREEDAAPGSSTSEGETDDSLKWRHIHQLASWVFRIHPTTATTTTSSSSLPAGDAGEDRMEEAVKKVKRCLEKLPDRDEVAGEDVEGSWEKDGMQGERSQDLISKQASPATKSPFSKRKSRRGKRRSPLVKKPPALRQENLVGDGADREERLMFEKISKLLPTTVLVTLSPDDIEPLPQDFDLDDDDYDGFPNFGDVNNNIQLREWDGECGEEPQLVNADDRQSTSALASEHVDSPPSTPARVVSREQLSEKVHPSRVGQLSNSKDRPSTSKFQRQTSEHVADLQPCAPANRAFRGLFADQVQPSRTGQPSNSRDRPSTSTSEHVADCQPSAPAKTASRELFAEQVQPPGNEQSMQNVLEIDELFDSHSGELLRDVGMNKENVEHASEERDPSQTADDASSQELDMVHTPFKMYQSHTSQSPKAVVEEVGTVINLEESETLENQSEQIEGDSIIVGDQASQSSQDDDETQLPASPSTSHQSPKATASKKFVVNRCLMPSTSSATLSDSSHSDFVINVSGDSDFTVLKCSIDDRLHKEHTTDGTGDHEEHFDIDSGSESDIFSPPEVDTEVCKDTASGTGEVSSESTQEVVESHVEGQVSPKTSIDDTCSVALAVKSKTGCDVSAETAESGTTDIGSDSENRCVVLRNEKDLPRITNLSRKRKQGNIIDECDRRGSTEKRIRFADQEQSSACLDESLVVEGVPFVDGHRVWTSTQKDGEDDPAQEIIFVLSSEEEISQRESAEKQTSSSHSSGMCLSGWISKQDMVQRKRRTISGGEDINESGPAETEVSKTPDSNGGSTYKLTSEESSLVILSSGDQTVDSCVVDTQKNESVKDIVHSLVSSGPSEGSAKDSDKTADLSVTPVLFSSGESTKAANIDDSQQQEQVLTDKTVLVAGTGEIGGSRDDAFCHATQHVRSLDEEEPMSIDASEDSFAFNTENIAPQTSAAGVANKTNSPDENFTRLKHVSLSSSGRYFVKETQPEPSSVPSPVPSNLPSSRSPTPDEKVTKSPVQVQNVVSAKDPEMAQVITLEETDKKTSSSSNEGILQTANKTGGDLKTSHQKSNVIPAELPKVPKNLTDEPKCPVTQSVLSSKIYMGSVKMRQLTLNKNRNPPVTQGKPSSKSKDALTKRQHADAQTIVNTPLTSGQNSRKGRSDVERKTRKDTSMDASITSDVTSNEIRFTSLGKSPSSGKKSGSKTRAALQAEESRDRSGGSTSVSSTRTSRTKCINKSRKSSDRRRKKQSRRDDEDIECNSPSPVFSLPIQDQDENLPSSFTESMVNSTHLPSSDDSASLTGEEALLDWCAMYLLESSKR